ncbi:hypothetical protein MMC27_008158 [Xylographa pallens]|nr:hypothetical protein [Xylographa pallens]
MDPSAGPQGQYVPCGPRHPGAPRRSGAGGGEHRKRKAWLEILPDAPSPPARTHGNPFGFSNVPADRAIPLAVDHPLKEELAEVKRVRESRRIYWLQLAEELPDDMNNPGSYDYHRWKKEENAAEAKIEELAGLIALAERGITIERAGSLPVVIPVQDNARKEIEEGVSNIRKNELAPSPPAIRSAYESNPRGSYRGTVSTREKERASSQRAAPGARDNWSRQPTAWQKRKRKGETHAQRAARREQSKARLQHSQPPPRGSVTWTDNAKSEAVNKWMSDMGAAISVDRTIPNIPLYIGSTGSGICALGDDELNRSDRGVANHSQHSRRLSLTCYGRQDVWSPEDEVQFEEAETEREDERLELAAALNAESHRTLTTEKTELIASDQFEQPLPASVIKTERSEPTNEEIAEKKSKDLLAALMAELDSRSLSPSPEPQPLGQSPPALELARSPLLNLPLVLDRDQAVADAVWKALQARKAQKAAAAAELQNKDASDWMDIDKVAPIEVIDLQDVPDVGSDEEEIEKGEDSEQARRVFTAPAPLSGRVLYVGNLSFEADEAQLRDIFRDFQVESVIIPHDPGQARPPGHAFIIVKSAAEAESAIADSFRLHIDNRLITVRLESLPKQYLSTYELPSRVAETTRGRNAVIHSPNERSRHKPLLSTGTYSGCRSQNCIPSSLECFDKETVREVEEMLNNPTISCKGFTEVQLQQHKKYVATQLQNIKNYGARRDEGQELHFKEIRLINRKKDFTSYMNDLEAFQGLG